MELRILKEAGVHEALVGMAFSYETEHPQGDECSKVYDTQTLYNRAKTLAHKDGGHNKFLESIVVWMTIRAPLYWWKQFDTYRVGVTKQSKSTMHTLMKRPLNESDFAGTLIPGVLETLNMAIADKNFNFVNDNLPNSFMQTRMVCTNYKTIRNICQQRAGHKLGEWSEFINYMYFDLNNPELIFKEN